MSPFFFRGQGWLAFFHRGIILWTLEFKGLQRWTRGWRSSYCVLLACFLSNCLKKENLSDVAWARQSSPSSVPVMLCVLPRMGIWAPYILAICGPVSQLFTLLWNLVIFLHTVELSVRAIRPLIPFFLREVKRGQRCRNSSILSAHARAWVSCHSLCSQLNWKWWA